MDYVNTAKVFGTLDGYNEFTLLVPVVGMMDETDTDTAGYTLLGG